MIRLQKIVLSHKAVWLSYALTSWLNQWRQFKFQTAEHLTRETRVLFWFFVWETDSTSKPLEVRQESRSQYPSNLSNIYSSDSIATSNVITKKKHKKKQYSQRRLKASHCGNITRSPAELWKSGNPWQCDFCFSLCIKSRCQEPSPPQPGGQRIDPAWTSLPFPALCIYSNILLGSRCLCPQQLWSTCDLKERGKRERCRVHYSSGSLNKTFTLDLELIWW